MSYNLLNASVVETVKKVMQQQNAQTTSLTSSVSDVINIIHFNDVYNINPVIKKDNNGNIISITGGASRFKSFINMLSTLKPAPVILFSGDFLSPSDMSTVTNGSHMISVMNTFNITCGMIGNHDLDYGNDHCIAMLSKLNYPTLNANILTPINTPLTGNYDNDLKLDLEPLGKCIKSYIYKYSDQCNIGIVGVSEDWSCTLPIKPENGIIYIDFITECQKYVNLLINNNDIHLMIVLTHSRLLNDQLLASKLKNVDLILGGHDHMYHCGMNAVSKTMIVKSGCDFKNISWLQASINDNKPDIVLDNISQKIVSDLSKSLNEKKGTFYGTKYKFVNRYYNIDMNIAADVATEKLVYDLSHDFQQQINKTIGYIDADLDARFSVVRTKESTSGNFIADVIRRAYHCDGVILCGGALRGDFIIQKGAISYKDILKVVPFQDAIVVLKLAGSTIIKALEHSVSGCPNAEGRFPQISGIRFVYDPFDMVGKRIKKVFIAKYVNDNIVKTIKNSYNYISKKHIHNDVKKPVSASNALSNLLADNDYNDDDNAKPNDKNVDDVYDHIDDIDNKFELIQATSEYTIATRAYLANGGDGFDMYKNETIETLIDDELGLPMSILVRNFFWAINTVNRLLKMDKNDYNNNNIQSTTNLSTSASRASSPQNLSLKFNKNKNDLLNLYKIQPKKSKTSMLRLKSYDLGDDDDNDNKNDKNDNKNDDDVAVDELRIKPCIENRIMTVDQEIDLESDAMKPMKDYFRTLPSFVGMKHLPRQQSLLMILDEIDDQQ